MSADFIAKLIYLLSAVLFIIGLKRMTRVKSARGGNLLSAFAMLLAVVGALIEFKVVHFQWIAVGIVVGSLIGAVAAIKVEMTSMPEMVALFNGSGGAASAVVALAVLWGQVIERTEAPQATVAATMGAAEATTLFLSIIIGGVTLSGSVVAYLKLAGKMTTAPVLLPGRHVINAALVLGSLGLGIYFAFVGAPAMSATLALALTAASVLLGILLVIPIGGADMPVVISLLNSYSGVAASATGFVISNNVLIISGAMVGAAGLILTQIMCVAMNRSLANVIFGGFGAEEGATGGGGEYQNVTSCGTEEAAMILENASSVIFVPGYGLAVAQAQHAVRELADLLKKNGCEVKYAIHPVAGRMPGHM
ncbi:MAG: NAD(P)(+) transhydrogenase (Re/Si-specific) subunit beta, partial [Myxococcales bacterium]|nr:NAD(P)(+) transhydrogenase (Re/Si-specific) subunit beta [Myxococcales bacterium]